MNKNFNISIKKDLEKKLIQESYSTNFNTKPMKESDSNGEKRWFLEGTAIECNIKNGNGRVYPDNVMKPAVKDYKYVIENKLPGCLGELGHPSGQNPDRADSDISFDWVSHMIIDLKEGKNYTWSSKSKILKNPIGLNYVIPLLEEGITLAFSTRGFGESMFSESEKADIVTDYKLLTIDLVATPSAPHAQQKGIYETAKKFTQIMTESKSGKPRTTTAKNVNFYYETLELFKNLGKEDVFVETMESYAWNYGEFYKDFSTLTTLLLKGTRIG